MNIPGTREVGAKAWLRDQGFVPVTPVIRSSDYDLANSCPFKYYLKRRLQITVPHTASQALINGSWFHVCLEYKDYEDGDLVGHVQTRLNDRIAELRETCKIAGYHGEAVQGIVEHEASMANQALGRYIALRRCRFPHMGAVFDKGFDRVLPDYIVLGYEVPVQLEHESGLMLSALIDVLLFNPKNNKIYILDMKTTSYPTAIRLQTCPFEFQTRHYSYIVNHCIEALKEKFDLPPDTGFGGMYHLAVLTPSIRMGREDVPYIYRANGARSGLSGVARMTENGTWTASSGESVLCEGVTEQQAFDQLWQYCQKKPAKDRGTGEPSLHNYINRCYDWYQGVGQYAHLRAERDASCPFNLSITRPSEVIEGPALTEYQQQLNLVIDLATRDPEPGNFIRNKEGVMHYRRVSDYAGFYGDHNLSEWPDIMRQHRLVFASTDVPMTDKGVACHLQT